MGKDNRGPKIIFALTAFGLIMSGCQSDVKISQQECVDIIKGITQMPMKMGVEVEGDFYSVFERSAEKDIADCLLSQITNTEAVDLKTPSPGPKPQFVVGDVSVFMLTRMYDIPFTTFLSRENWDRMGIYEYYRYIQLEGARETVSQTLKPIVEADFEKL